MVGTSIKSDKHKSSSNLNKSGKSKKSSWVGERKQNETKMGSIEATSTFFQIKWCRVCHVRRLRLDLGVLLCHFRFQLLDVFLRLFELRRQSLVPDSVFVFHSFNAHIMHILHRYYGICIVLFVKYYCIYLYFFKIILQFLYVQFAHNEASPQWIALHVSLVSLACFTRLTANRSFDVTCRNSDNSLTPQKPRLTSQTGHGSLWVTMGHYGSLLPPISAFCESQRGLKLSLWI